MSVVEVPSVHEVIAASAGSGKTWQLTARYLRLLDRGVRPDRILATTFSRNAAGEILERLLADLAGAALRGEALKVLDAKLARDTDARRRTIGHEEAESLLATLVVQLPRLRVGTIDSFFVRLAGAFELELGLPPGWRIVEGDEAHALRTDAVRRVLDAGDREDLAALVRTLHHGDSKRSVHDQLVSTLAGLHATWLETGERPEAWRPLEGPAPLERAELDALLGGLDEVPQVQDGRYAKKWVELVDSARARDWKKVTGESLVKKALDEETPTYNTKPIPPQAVTALRQLAQHAVAQRLAELGRETEAARELVARYDAAWSELRRTRRALRFEDLPRLLGAERSEAFLAELGFRLDGAVDHLLLDEFQDTSRVQWRALAPLAGELLATGDGSRTFFCVGDVKQSIYGWRGGEPDILRGLRARDGVRTTELARSWRSSRVVLDLVNEVFGSIGRNAGLKEEDWESAALWAEDFEAHEAVKDLPGHARLVVGPALAGEGHAEARRAAMARRVAEHVKDFRERTGGGRTVGVLVRKNALLGQVIHELRELDVPASEEGGVRLADDPAVQVMLSLLRLADTPGDRVARFHVQSSPFGPGLGLPPDAGDAAVRAALARLRRSLVERGYGDTLRRCVTAVAAVCDRPALRRLLQLVTLARRYDARASLRPRDFVEHVQRSRVDDPEAAAVRVMTYHQAKGLEFDHVVLCQLDSSAADFRPQLLDRRSDDGSEVERVSRAGDKALRQQAPSLDALWRDARRRFLRDHLSVLYVGLTRAAHSLEIIVSPHKNDHQVGSHAKILLAALAPGELEAEEAGKRGKKKGDRKRGKTATSAGGEDTSSGPPGDPGEDGAASRPDEALPPFAPGKVLREEGDPDWHLKCPPPGEDAVDAGGLRGPVDAGAEEPRGGDAPPDATAPLRVGLRPSQERRRALSRESPSGREDGTASLRDRLRLDTSGALRRGTAIHRGLEAVGWIEDGVPGEAELRARAIEPGTPEDDAGAIVGELRAALERPAVRGALSREERARALSAGDAEEAQLDLRRELPFALREGDRLLSGAIDRLAVLQGPGGTARAAEVVDFKTDAVAPEDTARIDRLVEHYRPQLEAYRRAAARYTGLSPERVTARLVFTAAGVVRET